MSRCSCDSHPVACEARSGSATLDGAARDDDAAEERAAWNGEHECFHESVTAPRAAERGGAGAGAAPRLGEVEAKEVDSLSNAMATRGAANTANRSKRCKQPQGT